VTRPTGRINVTGVDVDLLGIDSVVNTIIAWTNQDTSRVAIGVNANVCNLAADSPDFARLVSAADLRYADGQSIVWAARLLGGRIPERVATTDLIKPLAETAERLGKRIFLLGAAPGVASAASRELQRLFPRLQITAFHGYFPSEATESVLENISLFSTDILLVGMGDPRQQEWVSCHRTQISAPAILTCGGLFDWISGNNRRAPRWMIRLGLEWLWRMMIEPKRLTGRYLRGNPKFLARLLSQRLLRKESSECHD